jgi:predicted ribosome quality control (RQC) complex YloA/Tae2 family protein
MITKDLVDVDNNIYNVVIGRNKNENWDIISKASQNDIWFHVDSHPSPHVVLSNVLDLDIKKIPKSIIKECAVLCKEYSKLKNNNKVSIIYTYITNVTKGQEVGSVITKKLEKIIV